MRTNDLTFVPQYCHGNPHKEILRRYFTAETSKVLGFPVSSRFLFVWFGLVFFPTLEHTTGTLLLEMHSTQDLTKCENFAIFNERDN